MKACFYLPGIPSSRPSEGKEFVFDPAIGRHVWRGPKGGNASLIYDLDIPAERDAFHAAAARLISRDSLHHRLPLPFVFESAPKAAPKPPPRPQPVAPPEPAAPPPAEAPAPAPPPAALPAPESGVCPVPGGFALTRMEGDTLLMRGLEEVWSSAEPPDPFITEAQARAVLQPPPPKQAPKKAAKKAAKP